MIEFYKNPQGKLIKTHYMQWDKINPDVLVTAISKNLMNKNDYLNRVAKSCLEIFNRENKTKHSEETLILFDIIDVKRKSDDSILLKINFYFPANGYSGLIWDEKWTLLWIEKVAYKLAKEKSFEEYIKEFESRYPAEFLPKMKNLWDNYK